MSDSSSSAISSLASEYRERYHAVDPHVPIAYAVPERKQFSSREHLDDTHVSRSEHFADLSIPAGIRHVLWALLWETERIQAALTLQRDVNQVPFTDELCRELDALSPHFARASRTHYRHYEAGLARAVSVSMLDVLEPLVCGASSRI